MLKPSVVLACGILLLTSGTPSETRTALANSTGPYQAPTYCEGDAWDYAFGEKRAKMTHKVLRVADNLVEMDNRTIAYCLGCRFIFDRTLALRDVLRADGASIPETAARWRWWEFPLEVGKGWQFSSRGDLDGTGGTRNGAAARIDVTLLVEAFEDVTVPAGTFRAFRTRRDLYQYTTGTFANSAQRWSQRVWFAPAVKWMVKFTSTRLGEQEWELTAYQLSCQP